MLLLALLFLRRAEVELGSTPRALSASAERALLAHTWPGNVRELKSTMRRAALLCDGDAIEPHDLRLRTPSASIPPPDADIPLAEARERFVAEYAKRALDRHEGNREAAAAALGDPAVLAALDNDVRFLAGIWFLSRLRLTRERGEVA